MKQTGALAGIAVVVLSISSPTVAGTAHPSAAVRMRPAISAALLGDWVADDPDTRSLARVEIRKQGSGFLVRVWGRCHPTDCPWGEAAALLRSDVPRPELQMVFEQGFATRRMSIRVVQPDLLAYRVETTFNDQSGRAAQVSEELLKAARQHRARGRRL